MHLGFQANTRFAAHIEGANAFGAIGFVGGQAHQIDGQLGHVNLDFAGGLGCIDVEDDAALAAHVANRHDVLNDADFIVDMHHADERCVGTDRVFQLVQVEQAVFLHIQVGDFKTLALEFTHGVEHGFVLGFHSDQVLALGFVELRCAFDGQVVRLGGTRGPNDFTRISTNQVGHVNAGFFNGFFSFPAPGMAAGSGVAEMLAQPGDHGVDHPLIAGVGGTIVQVNREMRGHVHVQPLTNTLPSANTELGALTRMGLTTGMAEIARLCSGLSSTCKPLASWSSTSFCKLTELKKSIMRWFKLVQSSWVMQRPVSPRQFSLPPQCVASMGSSTDKMMSATEISWALRPKV